MCRNLALDRLALHERRNSSLDDSHLQTPDVQRSPHEQLERDERMRVVKQLIEQLPEKQRTALHLRDVEGKSTEEVATLLQTTEANVKVLVHRARQFIKAAYLKIENYGL
jgi:RNA polymerase sigma-70 factor (ECF subfamily)